MEWHQREADLDPNPKTKPVYLTRTFGRPLPATQRAWPDIQAALFNHGLSGTLDLSENKVTISITGLMKWMNPDFIARARVFLLYICTPSVPPETAIRILNGELYHGYVNAYNTTFLKKHGIRWELAFKMVEQLKRHAKALGRLTHCQTSFEGPIFVWYCADSVCVELFRKIVDGLFLDCIDPAVVVNALDETMSMEEKFDKFEAIAQLEPEDLQHVLHIFYATSPDRALILEKAWPGALAALTSQGFTAKLEPAEGKLTGLLTLREVELDIVDRAVDFMELLCRTAIPPKKAIKLLEGKLQYEYIKIADQEGGICAVHGISKKRFSERLKRLREYSNAIGDLFGCHLYVNEESVVVTGRSVDEVMFVRTIVTNCIRGINKPAKVVKYFAPLDVARRFEAMKI